MKLKNKKKTDDETEKSRKNLEKRLRLSPPPDKRRERRKKERIFFHVLILSHTVRSIDVEISPSPLSLCVYVSKCVRKLSKKAKNNNMMMMKPTNPKILKIVFKLTQKMFINVLLVLILLIQ